ncbi:MAG: ABC transporter substrate-binding protein [Burkholderiaceae bacterium]|jgi:peptide/nickel transport system substrate-binding protein
MRSPHRAFVALLIFLVFATPFAAAHADTLRIGLSADVTSMDPHWNNSGPNVAVSAHIFDPLTLTDRNGRLIPGLATRWRTIDPLTWEFTLREGVKFHDGSDFTAEDVVFSLERPNTLTGSPGPFTPFVKTIVSTEIVDAHTVRVKTASPYVLLPYDLNAIFIVSRKAADKATPADFDNGRAAIGTGPFALESFQRGDRIELRRNPGYWGGKASWEHVTLRLLTAGAPRMAALLSDDVDVIEYVPTADASRLRSDPRFKLEQQVSWRTLFWHMDQFRDVTPDVSDRSGKPLARNPFKDARVRLAISKAINRDQLVRRIMENLAVPASNLVAPGIFGYNPEIPVDAYDPEGAKALLAQAGYPDGFRLVLHAPKERYVNDVKVAEAVAGMLSRVGILSQVAVEPWVAYLPKARAGSYSFALIGWGSTLGDNTIKAHLATPNSAKGYGSWNMGKSSQPELDAMLDHDFQIFDEADREKSTRAMMSFGLRNRPVIVMYHQMVSWAMKQGISYPGRVDEFTLAQQFTRP